MNQRKLLIPHDGSALSGQLLPTLIPLVGAGVTVTLLHVDDGEGWDEAVLSQAEGQLANDGAIVKRRTIRSSDPGAAILDVAAQLEPDLIAMTTHGRTGLQRWVRGSVAERVLRACPVPVLMVNPVSQASPKITSVLVPLDSSSHAAEVLDTLAPFALTSEVRITLLFVDWLDPTDTPAMAARRAKLRAQDIDGWLSAARTRAEAEGFGVDVRVEHGDVAEQILLLTASGEYDLLAMTTHGRSGPGRWLLGSIAEKVLRECRTPVLLQRSVLAD